EHRSRKLDRAAPYGEYPVENLDTGRYGNCHCGYCKNCVGSRPETNCEHVVSPNHEPEETDQDSRKYHRGVTKQSLTCKCSEYFREYTECRQNQDVNFRVHENPEQMLPDNRVPPRFNKEETGSEHTVKCQQENTYCKRRECEYDEH